MARGKTIHFLLTYDRSERRLVNMERFHNGRKAVDAYGERERKFDVSRATPRTYGGDAWCQRGKEDGDDNS